MKNSQFKTYKRKKFRNNSTKNSLKYISEKKLIIFTQSFKMLLESGLTISESLELLLAQEKNPAMFELIESIYQQIITGSNLYLAFSSYSKTFGATYLNLLLVGEESGNLTENLEKIYKHLLFKQDLKRRVYEALLYPTVVFLFIVTLLILMLTFVFPNFISLFEETDVELPLLTKIILYLSKNIFSIIFIFLLFIVLLTIFLKNLQASKIEKIILVLPLIGRIFRTISVVFFCENFATLTGVGVNFLKTLELLKNENSYNFLKIEIKKIEVKLRIGNSIYFAFNTTSLFSQTQLKLIEIGEKSGNLSTVFNSIALSMKKELEQEIFKFTTLLQPLLLLILAIIVGLVVLAIYLPIFNISEVII